MDSKVEGLECFQYLVDSVPKWIKSLEDLQSQAQRRKDELAELALPAAQSRPKKTSSNESVRGGRMDTSLPPTPPAAAKPSAQYTPHAYQPVQPCAATPVSTRKRKTTSLISAVSGIRKYRSRNTTGTVYYDSEVQHALDRMVQDISTGRNHIRVSQKAERGISFTGTENGRASLRSRTQGLSAAKSMSGGPEFSGTSTGAVKSHRLSGWTTPPVVSTPLREGKSDIRAVLDEYLDKASTLCERGAHQFLREGDCSEDIQGARDAFEQVLRLSGDEVERLQLQAAERARHLEEDRVEDRHRASEDVADTFLGLPTSLPLELSKEIPTVGGADRDPDGVVHQHRDSLSKHPALMQIAGLVEADDDDDPSGDDLDTTALPRPPMRSPAKT